MSVDEVINRVVESVWRSQDRSTVAIVFADGTCRTWFAEGDDASNDCSCWIEHIENFDFKGKLLSIETSGINPPDIVPEWTARAGWLEFEGDNVALDREFITFKTERGRLLIELRASHNGYYQGRLAGGAVDVTLNLGSWIEVAP